MQRDSIAIGVYSAQMSMIFTPGFRRAASLALAALCGALQLAAQPLPQPPCGAEPFPAYPDAGAAPVVKVWTGADWTPPACTGWSPAQSATLVVTAARFRQAEGAEGLQRRIGAVSKMSGLLYWSTSGRKWQPLILDAYALAGPDGTQRRQDFAPGEIAPGRSLYLAQQDNLLGMATYEMRVQSAGPDRLVFATENRSAIAFFGLTLFAAADIRSICFLDRESKDVWRYYSLARMPKQAGVLTLGHDASLINRAVAVYRYLAGIPADREPPAAR